MWSHFNPANCALIIKVFYTINIGVRSNASIKNMQHPVSLVDEATPHPNFSPEGAEGDSPTTSDPERGVCKLHDAAAEPGLTAPTRGYSRTGQPWDTKSLPVTRGVSTNGSDTHPRTLMSKNWLSVRVLRVLG